MFPKMPILDGSSEASIRDWDTDMQVFQEELDEAISHVLDRETTLEGLAAALTAGLTPYNDGDWDPVEVFVKDNAVSIENGGSGDGCDIIRRGDKWWLKSTDFVDHGEPTSEAEQHVEVARTATCYFWWGTYEDMVAVAQSAYNRLNQD